MSKYYVDLDGKELGFEVTQGAETMEVRLIDGGEVAPPLHVDLAAVHANVETGEGLYSLLVEGKSYQMSITKSGMGLEVLISGQKVDLRVLTEREWRLEKIAPKQASMAGPYTVKAPMPGLVKSVLVAEGDEVAQGSRLLVLEAMKMENEIMSIKPGRVTEVHVQAGTVVEGGRPLVTIG
ncbi:MAG TPA: biotin/lipoyl-containing protein [Chloroflexia bacterium]|nr:biotin/lipoyl-containing protein [Chloroflexia bacterium]